MAKNEAPRELAEWIRAAYACWYYTAMILKISDAQGHKVKAISLNWCKNEITRKFWRQVVKYMTCKAPMLSDFSTQMGMKSRSLSLWIMLQWHSIGAPMAWYQIHFYRKLMDLDPFHGSEMTMIAIDQGQEPYDCQKMNCQVFITILGCYTRWGTSSVNSRAEVLPRLTQPLTGNKWEFFCWKEQRMKLGSWHCGAFGRNGDATHCWPWKVSHGIRERVKFDTESRKEPEELANRQDKNEN